jgi:hypothetical protein
MQDSVQRRVMGKDLQRPVEERESGGIGCITVGADQAGDLGKRDLFGPADGRTAPMVPCAGKGQQEQRAQQNRDQNPRALERRPRTAVAWDDDQRYRAHALISRRLHLPDEAVAAPRQRLDVVGLARRFPQRIPQPHHGRVDTVVELDYRVVGPELVADLLAQNHLPRTLQQHAEYL